MTYLRKVEFQTFQLKVTLPFGVVVREHALIQYLNKKLNNKDNKITMIDAKDGIKWIITDKLTYKYMLSYKHMSEFTATIYFEEQVTNKQIIQMIEEISGNNIETLSQPIVANLIEKLNNEEMLKKYELEPPNNKIEKGIVSNVETVHQSIYITGQYAKYSREISNSEWKINGSSIEQIVAKYIVHYYEPIEHKFYSAGREDLDVRMLGVGRPFVLELVNPHKLNLNNINLVKLIEDQIKGESVELSVQINNLRKVTKSIYGKIKEGEETKTKTYRCIVYSQKSLTANDLIKLTTMKSIEIKQLTPLRVLHRRTLSCRKKKITNMKTQLINSHFFVLDITAQAGTYIKEFVHGDLQRTTPNITTILNSDCDIMQLDVLEVDLKV